MKLFLFSLNLPVKVESEQFDVVEPWKALGKNNSYCIKQETFTPIINLNILLEHWRWGHEMQHNYNTEATILRIWQVIMMNKKDFRASTMCWNYNLHRE